MMRWRQYELINFICIEILEVQSWINWCRYITSNDLQKTNLLGAALLASAPPSGNSGMIKRFFTKKPFTAIRLTWSVLLFTPKQNLYSILQSWQTLCAGRSLFEGGKRKWKEKVYQEISRCSILHTAQMNLHGDLCTHALIPFCSDFCFAWKLQKTLVSLADMKGGEVPWIIYGILLCGCWQLLSPCPIVIIVYLLGLISVLACLRTSAHDHYVIWEGWLIIYVLASNLTNSFCWSILLLIP